MVVKPFYTYAEVAHLEGRSVDTLVSWVSRDRKLPPGERRFPGAFGGLIPLADLKARYSMTNEDIADLDDPPPADETEEASA